VTVGWLLVGAADVPNGDGWLSPRERDVQARFRFPKRWSEWRLGRWTAKRAVAAFLDLPDPAAVEVLAAHDGAPEAFVHGAPPGVTVSISHRTGTALCAVAPGHADLGCDLEAVEPRSEAFARDYFTRAEVESIDRGPVAERDLLVTLVWSAKESALKALRTGLRADTREVEVEVDLPGTKEGPWSTLAVHHLDTARVFRGWWRRHDGLLMTVLAGSEAGRLQAMGGTATGAPSSTGRSPRPSSGSGPRLWPTPTTTRPRLSCRDR
jgi:4'-phosphopantetheinyl transferase